jgi:hypothetical protein
MWRKALFMPAAKQMSYLARLMTSMDFWKLRPDQKAVAAQPGELAPERFIAAEGTEARDLAVVYVPRERKLELFPDVLPQSPSVSWFNPRTGENNPAGVMSAGVSSQFPTPDPGDWLLVMKAGK